MKKNQRGYWIIKLPEYPSRQEVAQLSRVQGLESWSAFNNNSYKIYLA
jgi:hypothetical protein